MTKKQSSKSFKSQKNAKKGVAFKKVVKTNNNLGAQFYSRQGSRKDTFTKEDSPKK